MSSFLKCEHQNYRERERDFSSTVLLSKRLQQLVLKQSEGRNQELFFGYLMWVEDLTDLGHFPIVFQPIRRELGGKWSTQDMNQRPYGIWHLQGEHLAIEPLHWTDRSDL